MSRPRPGHTERRLSLDHHLRIGMELGAAAHALRDIRQILTAVEGAESPASTALTQTIAAVTALGTLLDRDLRDEFGAQVEVRKTYWEVIR
jgi:hypothetical protein